jgi:hypothetical protein
LPGSSREGRTPCWLNAEDDIPLAIRSWPLNRRFFARSQVDFVTLGANLDRHGVLDRNVPQEDLTRGAVGHQGVNRRPREQQRGAPRAAGDPETARLGIRRIIHEIRAMLTRMRRDGRGLSWRKRDDRRRLPHRLQLNTGHRPAGLLVSFDDKRRAIDRQSQRASNRLRCRVR